MWATNIAGPIPKDSEQSRIEELASAVSALSEGDYNQFLSRLRRTLSERRAKHRAESVAENPEAIGLLTKREADVLTLVASGYSRKEIGDALRISENTAATHIASIYRKLDINSIAEATHIAIGCGIVELSW